jgi:hypothetical protein
MLFVKNSNHKFDILVMLLLYSDIHESIRNKINNKIILNERTHNRLTIRARGI